MAEPQDPATPEVQLTAGDEGDQLDVLDSVSKEQPLRVDKIYIGGLERTRAALIQNEFERHEVSSAENIIEIRDALDNVHRALDGLDVFEDVDLHIIPNREGQQGKCDALLRCKEKQRLHIKAGTYVQANEGSVEMQATLRNTLGFAEQLQIAGERGSKGSNEFSLAVMKPRPRALPLVAELRMAQQFRNAQAASSFTERTRGAVIGVATDDQKHSLKYELGWRTVTDPSRRASGAVQQQLGHALKSGAVYTFRHSHWPTGFVSDGGGALKSTTELAGLGLGNSVMRFAKQRLQGFATLPLPDTSAFASFGAELGLMVPLGPGWRARPSSIGERFFLGGAGSLRGFHTNSVGPVDQRRKPASGAAPGADPAETQYDYLGGDLCACVSAALNFPLPHPSLRAIGLQGHVFLNAGNTVQLTGTSSSLQQNARNFFRDFRLSAGIGLTWPLQEMGNLEVNFTKILRLQDTDRPKLGIQLGFSPMVL